MDRSARLQASRLKRGKRFTPNHINISVTYASRGGSDGYSTLYLSNGRINVAQAAEEKAIEGLPYRADRAEFECYDGD